MALVPCIAVSLGYILLNCFLAEALRKVIGSVFQEGLLRTALNEALAAAELCACGFELIIVADHYGVAAYSVCLFILTIWWSGHWGDATACPYHHFEACLSGSMCPLEVVVRTVAQVVGGLAVFKYVQLLWTMEFAETHVGRSHSHAFENCSGDLQIPVLEGAAVEGVATLLCRLTSKYLSESEPQYASAIDSFVGTSLVVAAFDYSGGYYNPVLATGLKYGCKGHSDMEFAAVYWVGASLGAIASVYLYPILKSQLIGLGGPETSDIVPDQESEEQEEKEKSE